MSLLQEMQKHGLADCAYNRQFFTQQQQYDSYLYYCAKQGIKSLSFNSWIATYRAKKRRV